VPEDEDRGLALQRDDPKVLLGHLVSGSSSAQSRMSREGPDAARRHRGIPVDVPFGGVFSAALVSQMTHACRAALTSAAICGHRTSACWPRAPICLPRGRASTGERSTRSAPRPRGAVLPRLPRVRPLALAAPVRGPGDPVPRPGDGSRPQGRRAGPRGLADALRRGGLDHEAQRRKGSSSATRGSISSTTRTG
jgi:hypothetical protein